VEIFLHFTDISDMREKRLHIPDIKVFCGNIAWDIFMTVKRQNGNIYRFYSGHKKSRSLFKKRD
jgi:hypothetical protein